MHGDALPSNLEPPPKPAPPEPPAELNLPRPSHDGKPTHDAVAQAFAEVNQLRLKQFILVVAAVAWFYGASRSLTYLEEFLALGCVYFAIVYCRWQEYVTLSWIGLVNVSAWAHDSAGYRHKFQRRIDWFITGIFIAFCIYSLKAFWKVLIGEVSVEVNNDLLLVFATAICYCFSILKYGIHKLQPNNPSYREQWLNQIPELRPNGYEVKS